VFSIAATLLVLEIAVHPPGTALEQLGHEWPAYLGYVISFLTIGAAWIGHNAITDRLTRADSLLLRINLLLLLVVAFMPFPTKLIAEALHSTDSERVFVTLYGLTLLTIRLLLFALDAYVRREHLYAQEQADEDLVTERRVLWPVLAAYVIAILIGLAAPTAAVVLYLALAVFLVVPFRDVRRLLFSRSQLRRDPARDGLLGCLLDCLVEVLRAHIAELLGDLLLSLQLGLVQGILNRALPDDDEGGLALVDQVPELLDVRPGHATPQVAGRAARSCADDRAADDRGREENANDGADGSAAPGPVPGSHFVLVDMDLSLLVFGDHRGVVGPDAPKGVEVFDNVIVSARRRLVRIRTDVEEHSIRFRHVTSPHATRPTGWPDRAIITVRSRIRSETTRSRVIPPHPDRVNSSFRRSPR
jgi:TMEM175 potassium channel family protein